MNINKYSHFLIFFFISSIIWAQESDINETKGNEILKKVDENLVIFECTNGQILTLSPENIQSVIPNGGEKNGK